MEQLALFRITPKVATVLNYMHGFGHRELLTF
jgi:hypothetical protein